MLCITYDLTLHMPLQPVFVERMSDICFENLRKNGAQFPTFFVCNIC